jgi:ATP-dependent Clp protease ATP-binding subunit ClpA
VSVSGQTICRLAEAAADATEPETALATLTQLRHEVDEFERQQVARALTAGRSFKTIARALGVSRQAVHRRYRDLARRRRMSGVPPTPELRLVIEYARSEAETLGSPALAGAHLLLGIVRNGDQRGAAALTSAGVELDDLRRAAAGIEDDDLRAILARAVRQAKGRAQDQVHVEHVLRAALRDGEATARVLTRVGVAPQRVLKALDALPADKPDCREA